MTGHTTDARIEAAKAAYLAWMDQERVIRAWPMGRASITPWADQPASVRDRWIAVADAALGAAGTNTPLLPPRNDGANPLGSHWSRVSGNTASETHTSVGARTRAEGGDA